ncbi:class I SAM-dependent methyltransferase [Petropleomorpha daqingensis]|uniref:SAM-dependent methyltransferase n=1 Tax=Petropleomorpha daqingensis TaxID=2026353 RepID=A0A853CGT9_9ACTN|nr:SAM-dependent methyltransferase [Petropleomorpha daqingensis]
MSTEDGSPVEVYRRLPPMGEPELLHALAPGGRVLDLGAGTGRIADPLVALGHDVLAVDSSAEMLAAVRSARTHRARIEDLDLAECFDVVLLAGHLVNTPDAALRRALLSTAARHLADGGRVLLQWHEPAWFDRLSPGARLDGAIGPLASTLEVHDLTDGVLSATVTYRDGDLAWSHAFRAARLTRERLAAELRISGLRLAASSPAPSWLVASAARRRRRTGSSSSTSGTA